ncbi:MAG: histidine--tRNA ligase [Coprobacillus sp.]|nr:histidine--tRNA ligase [Coprobacillus sp.]
MSYQKVKGTHDFIKKDASTLEAIRNVFNRVCERYSFNSHYVPTMEYSELFSRSVGEGSDIVRKEMYTFMDKNNRSITLRPEFTAGIVRSIVENKLYATEPLPIKSCYFGPSFRYERPQSGRYREFYQGGVECVGTTSIQSDIEVLALVVDFLSAFALRDQVVVKVNHLGGEKTRKAYRDALKLYFSPRVAFMCPDCHERLDVNPLRILDCKVEEDQQIIKGAPTIDQFLSEKEKGELEKVCESVKKLGVHCEIDHKLVRGLDYYTGIVFEVHPLRGDVTQGAILGGGHYHNLVAQLGGPDLEGVGFSFGVERLMTLLSELAIDVRLPLGKKVYVMPLSDPCYNYASDIAHTLRINGFVTEVNYEGGKIGSMFKKAERLSMDYGVIVGEDELSRGTLQLKNLATQEQVTIKKEDLISTLRKGH